MADYTIEDIVYRDGGVSIIVNITAMDKDIYVNNSVDAFDRMTEYEVQQMVEESVRRFLACYELEHAPAELATAQRTRAQIMKERLKGPHNLKEREVKDNAN